MGKNWLLRAVGTVFMTSQQSQQILTVFFDLDGTLMDHDRAARQATSRFWRRSRRKMQFPEHPFADMWEESIAHVMQSRPGRNFLESGPEFVTELFTRLGAEVSNERACLEFKTYWSDYCAGWSLFDDVKPCLDALSRFNLGIVTNGDVETQMAKLDRSGVRDRFRTIVVSGEIGVSKPDPIIFKLAGERAGCPVERCIFVGDDAKVDIEGARNAGMKSVYIDRSASEVKGEVARIAFHIERISTLRDLPAFIDGLQAS